MAHIQGIPMGMGGQGMNQQAPAPMPDLDMANAGQSIDLQNYVDKLPPQEWEALQKHLATMEPDAAEKWLMDYARDNASLGEQAQTAMSRADALRVKQPEMVGEEGGFQMAASPLAHIGAGMQNYQAQKQFKQGQTALDASNKAGTSQMAQALRMRMGSGY